MRIVKLIVNPFQTVVNSAAGIASAGQKRIELNNTSVERTSLFEDFADSAEDIKRGFDALKGVFDDQDTKDIKSCIKNRFSNTYGIEIKTQVQENSQQQITD